MLGITYARTYVHQLRNPRKPRLQHECRVKFYVPAGWREGTVKTVCNEDSFGDVWVWVEYFEPAINADTGTWLKSTSVKVIKNTAA